MTARGVRTLAVFAAWAALACARPAGAADVEVRLPILNAMPGQTIQVPIEVSPDLSTFGVTSFDYHLKIDPAVVSNVTPLAEGLIWNWGPPFQTVTSTDLYVATAGVAPITATTTRLHTLQMTVAPGAVVGSSMVLILTPLHVNETTPSVRQIIGILRVRATPAGVADDGPRGIALNASPNPAGAATRIDYRLPAEFAGRPHTLAIFSLDGRRLRTLEAGRAPAGAHEVAWNLRDDEGRRVPAGVYFYALDCGGLRRARRLVVLE